MTSSPLFSKSSTGYHHRGAGSQAPRHPIWVNFINNSLARNVPANFGKLLHDAQSMIGVVETPAAVSGDCDDVLDTDAEPPREINPRFY